MIKNNMKKIIILATLTFVLASKLTAAPFDASKLTDNLAQSVSLSEVFFGSFSDFVNDLCYEEADSFLIKNQLSFDGAWYTGFDIYTDYGSQKGSLAQGYGDYLFGMKTKNLTLSLGTGGNRFGVFLTDINFNLPNNDPVSYVTVTDFSGTQIMNDIVSGVVGINNVFWAGAYFFTSAEYEPTAGGTLSVFNRTRISYWGVKGQFSNMVYGNALLEGMRMQNCEFSVNPLSVALFVMKKSLKLDVDLTTGINWKEQSMSLADAKTISKVNWKSINLPLNTAYYIKRPNDKITLLGGTSVGINNTVSDKSIRIADGYFGLKHKHIFQQPTADEWGYSAGYLIKGSYYEDKHLAYFGKNNNLYAFGCEANLFFEFDKYFTISGGWRLNYLDDLKSLPEAKDKNIFALDFIFKI